MYSSQFHPYILSNMYICYEGMQSKSKSVNHLGSEPPNMQQTSSYSEPWWRSIGYNHISPPPAGGNVSNSTSLECTNGASESNDGQSMSNDDLNEDDDDDTTKDSHGMALNLAFLLAKSCYSSKKGTYCF